MENPLLGLWKLSRFTMENSAKQKSCPLGEKPIGYIIYLPNGFMMVNLGNANRPTVQADSILDLQLNDDLLSMVKSYNSYCGRYEIKQNIVYHHIEYCLFSNWSGKTEERQFHRQGKQLALTGILKINQEACQFVAEWEYIT